MNYYSIEKKKKHLVLKFNRKCSTEEFIDAHEQLMATNSIGYDKLLVDTRDMGVVSLEGQNYVVTLFLPKMKALSSNGSLSTAVIVGNDVFSKFAVQNVDRKLKKNLQNIDHQLFDSKKKALEWLNCVDDYEPKDI